MVTVELTEAEFHALLDWHDTEQRYHATKTENHKKRRVELLKLRPNHEIALSLKPNDLETQIAEGRAAIFGHAKPA